MRVALRNQPPGLMAILPRAPASLSRRTASRWPKLFARMAAELAALARCLLPDEADVGGPPLGVSSMLASPKREPSL
jgi:hypothetical protein